jgi:hypothetical protein
MLSDRVGSLGTSNRRVLGGSKGYSVQSSVVELADGGADCHILRKGRRRDDVHVIACNIDQGIGWGDNSECGRSGVVGIPLASLAPRIRTQANMGRLRAHDSVRNHAAVSNKAVGTSAIELNTHGDRYSKCGGGTPHFYCTHTHKVILLENLGCGGGQEEAIEKVSERHSQGSCGVALKAHPLAMGVLRLDRRGVCGVDKNIHGTRPLAWLTLVRALTSHVGLHHFQN